MVQKDFDTAVLDFLSEKENLRVALEIAERIEEVKRKLDLDFWIALRDFLDSALTSSTGLNGWVVELDKEILNNPVTNCAGISLAPKAQKDQATYLYPRMEVESWHIFFGTKWKREIKEQISLEEVVDLRKGLENSNFKQSAWWLGWKWTDYYLRNNDFLLRAASEKQGLAQEAGNILWSLFVEFLPGIEKANKALANMP